MNTARINAQTANPFIYDTFDNLPNNADLSRCYLEVGNGNEYPDFHYKPSTDLTRVLEACWSMFTQTTTFKVKQFLIWPATKKFIQLFTLI